MAYEADRREGNLALQSLLGLRSKRSAQILVLILLAILGVVLILVGSLGTTRDPEGFPGWPQDSRTAFVQKNQASGLEAYRESLENRLMATLAKVNGAGWVHVDIVFDSDSVRQYAVNKTVDERSMVETSGDGVVRRTTETRRTEDLVLATDAQTSRSGAPIVVKEVPPQVSGVLIVAAGAHDSRVRRDLARAAETVLDVPPHRVLVLAAEKR